MAQVTIRQLTVADRSAAVDVINTAARWYGDFLPPDELHDPEMTAAQWDDEARRLTWFGGFLDGVLVAVMGLEYARDAVLLRHAYILPEHQHHGIGLRLTEHLEGEARREDPLPERLAQLGLDQTTRDFAGVRCGNVETLQVPGPNSKSSKNRRSLVPAFTVTLSMDHPSAFVTMTSQSPRAWFCVEAATLPSTAREVRKPVTSGAPISAGWRLPWKKM